jgi:hypothetical protein
MAIADCTTWECVNSFSNWLSAVGTIATAALALWLSVRDRRVNVKAKFSVGLVPSNDPRVLNQRVFILEFTNNGPRTATVTNHAWRLPFVKGVVFMFPNMDTPVAHLCSKLPLELTDGKAGHSFYLIDHFARLDNAEEFFFPKNRWLAWLRIWFFRLYIQTSVGKSIRVHVRRQVRRVLWRQYSDAQPVNQADA